MKNIVILGSTGSLGQQALEVLEKYPKDFKVIGLSANKSQKSLQKQAKKFKISPKNIVLTSHDGAKKLNELAALPGADIIINVLSGIAGIEPTKAALKGGKIVLLGNKESLVAEGKKIMKLVRKTAPKSTLLIPIDSEHNAIFEILKKYPNKKIKKIILPCSGGPFLGKTEEELKHITAEQALTHPKWDMGAKISIESATLINKGLEIIEAHYLFGLPLEKIEVKIHPECQIHGIVEFVDLSPVSIAYIAKPDMREHIENALLHTINKTPKREIRQLKPDEFHLTPLPNHLPGIEIVLNTFKKASKNPKTFPSKMLDFLQKEEKAINKFLQNQIKFTEIYNHLT